MHDFGVAEEDCVVAKEGLGLRSGHVHVKRGVRRFDEFERDLLEALARVGGCRAGLADLGGQNGEECA